ncbi:MAG: DNA polymerase IV [Desulfobulbaceae bacterium]
MRKPRSIIHLDMDAFYASVEVLDNPDLRGKPVIVGGASDRAVVSAASYEARTYGVHSAMPMVRARTLCPGGIFLPVRMERYREVSKRIMHIFHAFTPLVEPLSLDEAFLDVSGSTRLFGDAPVIAAAIRQRIREETGLTGSAGVATSKLVAKIASDRDKPDGLTVVEPGGERAFLAPLPIGELWGVGGKTLAALADLGITTIGDLAGFPQDVLTRRFGRHGRHLHLAANGIDDRPVIPEREAQSIGHEKTFASDVTDLAFLKRELLSLAAGVGERLRRQGLAGRTVTVKVKFHDFSLKTRGKTIARATSDTTEIFQLGRELLRQTRTGSKPVRLLGISVSNLAGAGRAVQPDLFGGEKEREKKSRLNEAMDLINLKYGRETISPAALLKRRTDGHD